MLQPTCPQESGSPDEGSQVRHIAVPLQLFNLNKKYNSVQQLQSYKINKTFTGLILMSRF